MFLWLHFLYKKKVNYLQILMNLLLELVCIGQKKGFMVYN
jgi:hypothetical protein